MKRRHLFEFHERPECPGFIRESIVETLGNGLQWGRLQAVVGPVFEEFCEQARPTRVLDLCSGSGRPAANLARWLRSRGASTPSYTLSDLFPNHLALRTSRERLPDQIEICPRPVDATVVDDTVAHDTRMIVNAFHHFDEASARAILHDCAAKQKSIFIFEGAPRGFHHLVTLAISMPAVLVALLANPLLAPKNKLLKAFFTYLCPLVPLAFAWDSVVSNWRIYDEAQLSELTAAIPNYRWTFREIPFGLGATAIAYYGIPEQPTSDASRVSRAS